MGKGSAIPLPADAPRAGDIYRHYKGDPYRVVGMALDSSDAGSGKDIWLVVYEPMYDDAAAPRFARPLTEWQEMVQWEERTVPRFALSS